MQPQPGPWLNELRVLVVEDEVMLRLAISDELRAAGFSVIEAGTADEAWAYLQAGGMVDLLFTDICMPGTMDGLALVRRVQVTYPAMRIVVTSGLSNQLSDEWTGRFLPKPYGFDHAVQFVREALDLKKRTVA